MKWFTILLCLLCLVFLATSVEAWPWNHPKPVPVPVAPVVVPDACTSADQLVVESQDRPGRHILKAIVKAPAKLAKAAVRLPVRILVAGHERRADRREARRGD